jgi:ABC-2 type transport system ATP-binding protein
MSEMALTAQHLLVIGKGHLLADAPIEDIVSRGATTVKVRSPRAHELSGLLSGRGATVRADDDHLEVTGMGAALIGDLAAERGIPLHELTPMQASLEEVFFELTDDSVDYHAGTGVQASSASTSA